MIDDSVHGAAGQDGEGGANNAATVRTFLRLLEDKDIDSWIELWAENAEQFYPFGTEMFPATLVGRAAIDARWRDTPAMFARLSFPVEKIWVDGDTVIARFRGDCVLRDGGRYANSYLAVFEFDAAGKIARYWEYFDPIVAGVGFGLAEISYLAAPG